jgi:hypothetical protein
LKLPASINDLIPPDTTIYSQAVKVTSDGQCQLNASLAYLVSSKLLQRLRKSEAKVVLTIQQVSTSGKILNNSDNNNTLHFSIAEAKEVVPQSPHKMDHIYNFIADKGAWCSLGNNNTELKAGIFFVAMPDNTKTIVHTPFIELKSPPPLPPYVKRTSYLTNNKKKISSIIGGQSINKRNVGNGNTKKQALDESNIVKAAPAVEEKPRLRRAKSSLADLNIDELAQVLQNIKIRTTQEMPSSPPPPPPPSHFLSYRQIGNGSSAYTFYFRIINADHIDPLLLRPTSIRSKPALLKKPYFSYAFHTTHNLIPASSFSSASTTRACFRLKGHLVDVQNWLDKMGSIDIRLVVMDKMTKQTVGMTKIPLQGLAFESSSLQTLSYPIYDEKTKDLATLKDAIAKITVRIGIMSGWHKDEEEEKVISRAREEEQDYKKRDNTTSILSSTDPWEMFHHTNDIANHNKKMRHHSQSSVPTLLTTSTTTTSSKSSSCYLVTPKRSNKKKHLFL